MSLPEEVALLDFTSVLSDVSLGELFERARTVHSHIDSIPKAPTVRLPVLDATLSWLRECESRILLLGLFSPNEDSEDLATGDLKYVLVPFYTAEILAESGIGDPSSDRQKLQKALQCTEGFLQRCQQYSLLGEVCRSCMEFDESGSSNDAHTRRNQKVARFKRGRDIEKQLEKLQRIKQSIDKYEKDAEENSHICNVDEEMERKIWMLTIEWAATQALNLRGILNQELKVVAMLEASAERHASSARPGPPAQTVASAEVLKRLTGVRACLIGQDQRQNIKNQVFQPTHILPTVTVEQQARREMKQALQREKRQKEMENQKELQCEDHDGDEELYKQRAWDDWKDDNPRGYGNSKLRPCAQ